MAEAARANRPVSGAAGSANGPFRRAVVIVPAVVILPAPVLAAVIGRSPELLVGLAGAAALSALSVCAVGGEAPRRASGAMVVVAAATSLVVTVWSVMLGGVTADAMPGLASQAEILAFLVLTAVAVRFAASQHVPIAVGAATLAVAVIPLRFRDGGEPALTVIGTVAWALVALAAAAVGHHLRSLDERRLRSVLEARQAQRLQLAGDLHDFVAHDVSEMLALAQAGSVMAADHPDDAELFAMIEQAAQRALRSMDQTVHMLHAEDPGPLDRAQVAPAQQDLTHLPELARRFEAANGVQVRLDVAPADDALGALPTDVSATLYRVAVEALTNVRRHAANARAVDIELRLSAARTVEMAIVDDGVDEEPVRPFDAVSRRNGLGLPAMAARVEALGGTMSAGRSNQCGWRIAVTVPVADRPPPPAATPPSHDTPHTRPRVEPRRG